MHLIDEFFQKEKNRSSDINEHFDTIKKYASECNSVIEMGVRAVVSTWAFLAGRPKKMISIDLEHPSFYGGNIDLVYRVCSESEIDFKFIKGSTLELIVEESDIIFIDTHHIYTQLKAELIRHGNKAKKYILLHDTETFKIELTPAIKEFVTDNPQWVIHEVYTNNNGLTVLKRICSS